MELLGCRLQNTVAVFILLMTTIAAAAAQLQTVVFMNNTNQLSKGDFKKNWIDFKHGFGNLTANFWHGNDLLYTLTSTGTYKLRVDMRTQDNIWLYAEYSKFSVDNEANNYTLHASGYSGTAGDSFNDGDYGVQNGYPFSTYDRDSSPSSCASTNQRGGFWYNNCGSAILTRVSASTLPAWHAISNLDGSLNVVTMSLIPI